MNEDNWCTSVSYTNAMESLSGWGSRMCSLGVTGEAGAVMAAMEMNASKVAT